MTTVQQQALTGLREATQSRATRTVDPAGRCTRCRHRRRAHSAGGGCGASVNGRSCQCTTYVAPVVVPQVVRGPLLTIDPERVYTQIQGNFVTCVLVVPDNRTGRRPRTPRPPFLYVGTSKCNVSFKHEVNGKKVKGDKFRLVQGETKAFIRACVANPLGGTTDARDA